MKKTSIITSTKARLHFTASGLILAGLALVTVAPASADTLFERGLPTQNLNQAAGGQQSNFAWADGQTGANDALNYLLIGDNFQNTSSHTWNISQITLWTIGPTVTAELLGGLSGSTSFNAVNSSSISPTKYADGSTYQGTSGSYLDLYQVTFAVNLTLAPGQIYDFFLNGTTGGTQTYAPFASASNAGLGYPTPPAGFDNLMLQANLVNGSFDPSTITPWSSGVPSGTPSDLNVQVSGTVPDAASTAGLLGLGFLTLLAFGYKQNRLATVK